MSERSQVYEWPPDDDANIDPAKSGMPEAMARSDVNDRGREQLGAISRWYKDPEWLKVARDADGDGLVVTKSSGTVVAIAGGSGLATTYSAGRRVRMTGGTQPNVEGHIVSAVPAGANLDITIEDFSGHTEVPDSIGDIEVHIARLGKQAYSESGVTTFWLPDTADSAGIQGAIDSASAAGGGSVLLKDAAYDMTTKVTIKTGVTVTGVGATNATCTAGVGLTTGMFVMQTSSSLIGATLDLGRRTP